VLLALKYFCVSVNFVMSYRVLLFYRVRHLWGLLAVVYVSFSFIDTKIFATYGWPLRLPVAPVLADSI
jgi:hypothetical protein